MQAFAIAQGANIAARMPYLFDADLQLKSISNGDTTLLRLKEVRCNYYCHISFDWNPNGGSYDLNDFGTLYCVKDTTFPSLHWISRAGLFGEVDVVNLFQGVPIFVSRIQITNWLMVLGQRIMIGIYPPCQFSSPGVVPRLYPWERSSRARKDSSVGW